ncbi:CoF synthetase [Flavobacterium sp.]|uniref:CoF synthetase n=1 Tax=Flavobacterium sp. TaxID=239 RepID=UPI003B9CEDF1
MGVSKNFSNLRAAAFWAKDLLAGSRVKFHYNEIESSFANNHRNKESKLKALLKHAAETTSFYANFKSATLSDFPLVNKLQLRNNAADFISSSFDQSKLVKQVTSGSTGTPLAIYSDAEKRLRNNADTLFFANKAGYKLGERLVNLKIWSTANQKSSRLMKMQNLIPIDVLRLDDNLLEAFCKTLVANKQPTHLVGYASALELLAKYIDKKNYSNNDLQIRSVIGISEGMTAVTKDIFQKQLGICALSRYSNIENGIIAQQQTNGKPTFEINSASFIVEIFKMDEDVLAHPGELGRIVITDLYNYAMPLIRYDTGDIGALNPNNHFELETIEGRKLDLIYDAKGNLISSYIVYKNMFQYTEILQYQFVQTGAKEYTFKINTEQPFAREQQLRAEFLKYLGDEANFSIEYVDEIPLLASGKRKKIVNTYHNKQS